MNLVLHNSKLQWAIKKEYISYKNDQNKNKK